MTATRALRIDSRLIHTAEKQTKQTKRSVGKQIEYWAELGRAAEKKLTTSDIDAVIQGKAEIVAKTNESKSVEMSSVFNELESDRINSTLTSKVINSKEWFDISSEYPGYLVKTNSAGKKEIGKFEDGEFVVSNKK